MARPAPTNCETVAADHVAPIKNQAFTETGLEHFSTQILYGLYNTAQHPIAMLYHLWHTGEQGVRDYQRDNRYQRGQVWGAGLFGVGSFVASDGLLDGDVLAGGVDDSIDSTVLSKHPLDGWNANQIFDYANNLGVKAPRNEFLLWSGLGKNGVELAEDYAIENGGMTLEMTPGGKWLNDMKLFGDDSPVAPREAYAIWERLSKSAIRQASGQVRSVLGQVQPTSIYRYEVQELLANDQVLGLDELYIKP